MKVITTHDYCICSTLIIALNYPCKKYQIIFVYMHEKQILTCKSEFAHIVISHIVHIIVMLKVISFSFLNMHEFVET